jgi:hypothetical protein
MKQALSLILAGVALAIALNLAERAPANSALELAAIRFIQEHTR